MAIYPAQVSFAAGELAPSLWGREDLAKYAVGLRELTNFTVHPHGGVSNRAGMRFVSEVKDSSRRVRLVSFESSENGCYILEFGNFYIRFYKDGARIMSGGAPYEIASPYAASELTLLNFAQSADVLFIAHPNHAPYELSRYLDASWVLERFAFKNGPFRNINNTEYTIALSGTNGSVSLTASGGVFKPGHVGGLFSIYNHIDSVPQRTSGNASSVSAAVVIVGSSYETESGDRTVTHRIFTVAAGSRQYFSAGCQVNIGGKVYSVAAYNADSGVVSFSPALAWQSGSISGSVLVENAASDWNRSVMVYKGWSCRSMGFWSGTVKLWKYNRDEGRYTLSMTFTSQATAASAKNYEESGTVDEPCMMKLTSEDFTQFLPEGNTEADKGFFVLTADEADYECYVRITSVASGTSAAGTLEKDAAQTAATRNWAEGSWNDYRGFPYAVGFYQDRLCFGGNASEPQSCWMSVTGDYNNFERHLVSQDDDSVTAALISRRVSPVRDMVTLSNLIVLTESTEWTIGAGSAKSAITPSALEAQVQGYRGCAAVPPVVIGDMVLFAQKQGKIIRDLGYVFESDSYSGNDLTVLASHFFRDSRIVSMDYQQDPDSIVWVVLEDGTLLALTYLREHDVIAWSRIETDGLVESVACVSTAERDETWLCVRRVVDGVSRRFVEMIAERHVTSPEDGFFVDCGVTFGFETASAVLTGLSHLEGRPVACLADGNVVAGLTVRGGGVTLPHPARKVHVGLPYTAALETLDLSISRRDGSQQGRKARLVAVTVRVENTRGLSVSAPQKDGVYSEVFEFKERSDEPYGAPVRLQTGLFGIGLASGYTSGRVRIEARHPLPCTLLSLIPKVAAGE